MGEATKHDNTCGLAPTQLPCVHHVLAWKLTLCLHAIWLATKQVCFGEYCILRDLSCMMSLSWFDESNHQTWQHMGVAPTQQSFAHHVWAWKLALCVYATWLATTQMYFGVYCILWDPSCMISLSWFGESNHHTWQQMRLAPT